MCVFLSRVVKAVVSFNIDIFVVSPVTRRQTSHVTAHPGSAQLGHSSRRSAAGQSTSRRQQVAHAMRHPVNPIQPQVSLISHCQNN